MRRERVLIIGSGAREHALAKAFARSEQQPVLLCFSGARNPGIADLCAVYGIGDTQAPAQVAAFAQEHGCTLAVIGPEAPLAAGVADALWDAGVPVVGPTRTLARIESSKSYTRDLLERAGIAGNPFYRRFDKEHSYAGLDDVLRTFAGRHVIKDDGLAGGKGVRVCGDHLHTHDESLAYCKQLMAEGHPFVIEEKMEGEEFSLMSFSDGATLRHMPAVQDHKRAFDGDTGPNTGGMGTYSDADHRLPFLTEEDIATAHRINEQVIAALARDCSVPYRGILYGGFMATRDGVRLIEYNARFGDPECLNILELLKTDLVTLCRAIVEGALENVAVSFAREATVCKYLVPQGYPDAPRRGDSIVLPDDLPAAVSVYLSAVDIQEKRLVATGSRTIAVIARAPKLAAAEALCTETIQRIKGPFFFRSDIGSAALIASRVRHMQHLREQ